jgi:BolA protein
MTAERVELINNRLSEVFSPVTLEIIDDSAKHAGHAGARSGGGHFLVNIVSEVFQDKSLIQRHRLIYEALGEAMKSEIHALSINAKTPTEVTNHS